MIKNILLGLLVLLVITVGCIIRGGLDCYQSGTLAHTDTSHCFEIPPMQSIIQISIAYGVALVYLLVSAPILYVAVWLIGFVQRRDTKREEERDRRRYYEQNMETEHNTQNVRVLKS